MFYLPDFFLDSSLSSGLNSVALIVLEDFIRPFFPLIEDHTATKITKGVAILFGCINFGMVLLVSQVQTILDVHSFCNVLIVKQISNPIINTHNANRLLSALTEQSTEQLLASLAWACSFREPIQS